jgi:hypothetical protein
MVPTAGNRKGQADRPYTTTPAKLRLAQAAMAKRDTKVGDLCKELGADGTKLLKRKGQSVTS